MSFPGSGTLLDTKDMSASFTSEPMTLVNEDGFCLHCIYSGATAPVGTLQVQVSLNGSNWEDLTGGSYSVSVAGTHLFVVSDAHYLMARVSYTRTSGSGTMEIHASIKD